MTGIRSNCSRKRMNNLIILPLNELNRGVGDVFEFMFINLNHIVIHNIDEKDYFFFKLF